MENRETKESKANIENAKKVEILAELCSEWGFSSVRNQVISRLVGALNKKGYDVVYTIEALDGGNGEYFVYQVINGEKKIIFSNVAEDEKNGAVIAGEIKLSNVDNIIKKIII